MTDWQLAIVFLLSFPTGMGVGWLMHKVMKAEPTEKQLMDELHMFDTECRALRDSQRKLEDKLMNTPRRTLAKGKGVNVSAPSYKTEIVEIKQSYGVRTKPMPVYGHDPFDPLMAEEIVQW